MKVERQKGSRVIQCFAKTATRTITYPLGKNYGWVGAHCMKLMALREQVHFLEDRVAHLKKLRQKKRYGEQNLSDLLEQLHFCADNSSAVAKCETWSLREDPILEQWTNILSY